MKYHNVTRKRFHISVKYHNVATQSLNIPVKYFDITRNRFDISVNRFNISFERVDTMRVIAQISIQNAYEGGGILHIDLVCLDP